MAREDVPHLWVLKNMTLCLPLYSLDGGICSTGVFFSGDEVSGGRRVEV